MSNVLGPTHMVGMTLGKYPRILAALLYGSCDPDIVTARVVDYARGYDDLEWHVGLLQRVIPRCLSDGLCELDEPDVHELDFAACEVDSRQVQFYVACGRCAREDVLLRIVALSELYRFPPVYEGLHCTCRGLHLYGSMEETTVVSGVLAAATFDAMLAYSWGDLPDTLSAHVSICAQTGMAPLTRKAITAKAADKASWRDLELCVKRWRQEDALHHIRGAWALSREQYCGTVAFSEAVFQRVEAQWRDAVVCAGEVFLRRQHTNGNEKTGAEEGEG